MSRTPLIVGNWKMNGLPSAAPAYASGLRIAIESMREAIGSQIEMAIAPPAPTLDRLGHALAGSGVVLAAQNVSAEIEGAFTGEQSAAMLEDLGCDFAILGHSERRELYGETDEEVAAKTARLVDSKLDPIVCVGETLSQRESGSTLEVVRRQLGAVLERTGDAHGPRLVVAYEPIWAIGTGQTATPELAGEVHASIRAELNSRLGKTGETIRILYGGSVKPSNARELLEQPEIDGALVGGASLKPEDFAAIAAASLAS